MTIEVLLPDGVTAEFPDGTPPEVMQRALSRYKSPPKVDDPWMAGAGRSVDRMKDGLTGLYHKVTGDTEAEAALDRQIAEKRAADQYGGLNDKSLAAWGGGTADAFMAMAPGAAANKLTQVARVPSFLRNTLALAAAAGTNAAFEGAKAPNPGETRADNAEAGAYWGAGGQIVGNVLGRAIRGIVPKGSAAGRLPQEVQDQSTVGQLADRTSLAGRVVSGFEEKLKSAPLVGDKIANARQRGVDAWRKNVIDEVIPPGGTSPQGGTMRDVMDDLQRQFGGQYKNALQGQNINPSRAFESRVLSDTSDPMAGLTQSQREEVRRMVMDYYQGMFSGAARPGATAASISTTPDMAKKFESFLSSKSRQHRMAATTPGSEDMAKLYDKIEDAWTTAYRSQLPVSTRKLVKPIDEKYAKFKTTERASISVGNEEGAFTPNQLLNSVKARTPKPAFARGEGLLQEEADAGKTVFQDKIANSGTTDRALNAAAAVAALADPISTATILGAGRYGVAPLLTSKTGKNVMLGETKAQMLLKKLRADQMLGESGVSIGQFIQDTE